MDQKRLEIELKKIIEAIEHSSLSLKRKLYLDYDNLAILYHDLGYGCPPEINVSISENYFVYIVHAHFKELEIISDKFIEMFKDIDFYSYYNDGYQTIPVKEKREILKEFLEYFNKDFIELYKSMYEENRIHLTSLDVAAESFFAPSIDSYYILMEDKGKSDINDLCTLLHELAHIYVMKVMKNYSSHAYRNIYECFLSEAVPLYIEYSFCEWLVNNHIYVDNVKFHQNFQDYFQLYWFKTIRYFREMHRRDDLTYYYDNVDYEFVGNNTLFDKDSDLPFFRYPSTMKKGNYSNLKYGISSLDAYKLLEMEYNGADIKKMLSDYCFKYQYFDLLLPDKFLDFDDSFMKNNIKLRTEELKKKYPIPGYTVRK